MQKSVVGLDAGFLMDRSSCNGILSRGWRLMLLRGRFALAASPGFVLFISDNAGIAFTNVSASKTTDT